MKGVLTLLLLVLVPSKPADASTAWVGIGLAPCAEYAQMYCSDPNRTDDIFFSWAQGFMSGLNTLLLKQPNGVADLRLSTFGSGDQQEHIRRFCDQRPLAKYMDAVFDLYDTLREHQGLANWRIFLLLPQLAK